MKRGRIIGGVFALLAAASAANATPTYPSLGQMEAVRQQAQQIMMASVRVHRAATPYARAGYPGELEALEKIRLVSLWARQVFDEMQRCVRGTTWSCTPQESIWDMVQLNRAYNRAHIAFRNLYSYSVVAPEMRQLTEMMENLRAYYGISLRMTAADLDSQARDLEASIRSESWSGDRWGAWNQLFKERAMTEARELARRASQLNTVIGSYLSDVLNVQAEVDAVRDAYMRVSISAGAAEFTHLVAAQMERVQQSLASLEVSYSLEEPAPIPAPPPVVVPPRPHPPVVVPPRPHPPGPVRPGPRPVPGPGGPPRRVP